MRSRLLTRTDSNTRSHDGRHSDLHFLIGPTVFSKRPEDLAGDALADHKIVQIMVKLSKEEGSRYAELINIRNDFLKQSNIKISSLEGWKQFIMASARSPLGRRAMLAHRQAKEIALCTEGKLRILAQHTSRTLSPAHPNFHRRQRHSLPNFPRISHPHNYPPNPCQRTPRNPRSLSQRRIQNPRRLPRSQRRSGRSLRQNCYHIVRQAANANTFSDWVEFSAKAAM